MRLLRKPILLFFFLALNIPTYGQKKNPFLKNIHHYIIVNSDTIKIQRYNGTEYRQLGEINPNYSIAFKDGVSNIEAYLDARGRGEISDNPDEIELRFNNLTTLAIKNKVYFNLENYKKEIAYYNIEEAKTKAIIIKQKQRDEEIKRIKNKRIADLFFAKVKADSLYFDEIEQNKIKKKTNDSIEYQNQIKAIISAEKERTKQETKQQITKKIHKSTYKPKNKLENEKKQKAENKINVTISAPSNK
jgi:hypothetical protein